MASFTAGAIAIAGSVAGSVASKALSSGGSSGSSGGSSGGGTTNDYNNFSGGGLITPATSLAGSIEQGQIAQQTADTQSSDIETGRTQANALLDPYNQGGTLADKQLADLQGLNGPEAAAAAMAKFQTSPGYAYNVSQGLRAVDQGAAAKGMLRSGQTLKAEQTLGNNLADNEFSGYITRLNSLITPGLTAGMGEASVDTGAAAGQSKIAGTLGTNLANTAGATTGAIGNLVTAGINGLSNIGKGIVGALGSGGGVTSGGVFDTTFGTGGTTGAANNKILDRPYSTSDGGVGNSGVDQGNFGDYNSAFQP